MHDSLSQYNTFIVDLPDDSHEQGIDDQDDHELENVHVAVSS